MPLRILLQNRWPDLRRYKKSCEHADGQRDRGLTGNKVKKFAPCTGKVFRAADRIETQIPKFFQGSKGGHSERQAGGDGLDRKIRIEIAFLQAQNTSDLGVFMRGQKFRIILPHFTEHRQIRAIFKLNFHGAHIQIEANLGGAAGASQNKCCSESRMTGEWQFLLNRKDTYPNPSLLFDGASRGRMNVVSDRFVSFAINCIWPSDKPVPFRTTASAFPCRGFAVNTSICTTASLLPILASKQFGVSETTQTRFIGCAAAIEDGESFA